MTKQELNEIVASHGRWLADKSRGERADLHGANLSGANLSGANLRGADLSDANLSDANLHYANLSDVDLRGANLSYANLSDANLSDANLHGANLHCADLRGADLRGADLRDANLSGADLRRANLHGANLRRAILPAIILQVGPIGSRKDYIVYNASDDNILCGCWNNYKGGTLEEFEAHVEEVYSFENKETLMFRNEYLAAIGHFKTVREECLKEETK